MRSCPYCTYSLEGLPQDTAICPECGKTFREFSPFKERDLIVGFSGIFLSLASAFMLWRSVNGPNLFGLPDSLAGSLLILGLVALIAIVLPASISMIVLRKWRWRAVFVAIAFLPSLLFVLWLHIIATSFP